MGFDPLDSRNWNGVTQEQVALVKVVIFAPPPQPPHNPTTPLVFRVQARFLCTLILSGQP